MFKLLFLITLTSGLDCLKDVCDKDCISDVISNKRNLSKESDHNITIASAVFDSLFNSNKWSQVSKDNISEYSDDLPHDFVPEISDYERGYVNNLLLLIAKSCSYAADNKFHAPEKVKLHAK